MSDSSEGIPSRSRNPVAAVLVVGLAAGFLLCGYELVRSVSVSLFIEAYGAHRLPVVMALSPVGLLAMLWGYGWLLSRWGSRKTLLVTSILSGAGILVCYLAIAAKWPVALGLLYILREAYIVLIIEQYWSFINSTLTGDQAKRINGPVCGIASIGAICGGLVVGYLAQRVGSQSLLIFAAASLIPAAGMAWWAFGVGGEPVATHREASSGVLGLGLFRQNRTLVYLALLIAATQAVSTALDLRFSGLLEIAKPLRDERTAFMGNFYALLNALAFLFQFVVAPLALRFLSLRWVHLLMPAVHLATCSVLLVYPTLATGAVAYLAFKVLDYSVFRAGKEILYIPLSFDARYRAKEVIDAFVYRGSKGALAGLFAMLGSVFGRLPGSVYPAIAMGTTLAWGGIAYGLTRSQVEGENGRAVNP
jgi:ATP:ADP antiporter, AAA family